MTEQPEKNFLDAFRTAFEMFSYRNNLYGDLCAHVLLGQVLKHIKIYFGPMYIDPRVSLFLIQPSATGKSTPVDFIQAIAQKAAIKMGDIDEITDSALIGHVDDEEVIDPETKTKTIVHNVIKGKLSEYDILHYDEGKLLLAKSPYSQNALTWFQKALNPIGSGQNLVTKNLRHGEITFHPDCSLLITTHELENLLDSVLNTGFFQRVILYPRYITIDDRKENEFLRADRFGLKIFAELDIEEIAKKLVLAAKENEHFEVKVNKNVYPIVRQAIDNRYKLIQSCHERVREIMATFLPRYDNLMYIFSLHHCCVNFKKEIDIPDIKYAIDLSHGLLKEVMTWVEENISLVKLSSRESAYIIRISQLYKEMEKDESGYVSRITFVKNFNTRWMISIPTLNRNIEKFKGFGRIKSIKKNDNEWIKIEI